MLTPTLMLMLLVVVFVLFVFFTCSGSNISEADTENVLMCCRCRWLANAYTHNVVEIALGSGARRRAVTVRCYAAYCRTCRCMQIFAARESAHQTHTQHAHQKQNAAHNRAAVCVFVPIWYFWF